MSTKEIVRNNKIEILMEIKNVLKCVENSIYKGTKQFEAKKKTDNKKEKSTKVKKVILDSN